MATTRPEASETTGTLRETSGVTAPVTTNSETVGCAVAAASGNCSGWSIVKRLRSTSGTTLAGGGAAATASTGRLQPPSIGNTNKQTRKRPLLRILLFIRTRSPLRQTNAMFPKLAGRVPTLWRGGRGRRRPGKSSFNFLWGLWDTRGG